MLAIYERDGLYEAVTKSGGDNFFLNDSSFGLMINVLMSQDSLFEDDLLALK